MTHTPISHLGSLEFSAAHFNSSDTGVSAATPSVTAGGADFVIVPDAQLLFTADFKKSGPDLVLTGHDGHRFVVYDYFNGEKHPALLAPNGAGLTPDLVDLLSGSVAPEQYAQAGQATASAPIGKVEKVAGTVTVVRNGVAVALNVGDAVYKSDVVQTGLNSSVGISFPDGTALNLVANTRMALNEYVYDSNSTSNSALFSLVEGTFAFVAGKVAHTGDMKIATPVATMGVRGTTGVFVTITAAVGTQTYAIGLSVDYDGATGLITATDQYGNSVDISRTGNWTFFTPQGLGQPPLISTAPTTPDQQALEQLLVRGVWESLHYVLPTPGAPGSSTPFQPFEQHNELFPPLPGTTITIALNLQFNGPNGPTDVNGTANIVFQTTSSGIEWISPTSGNWDQRVVGEMRKNLLQRTAAVRAGSLICTQISPTVLPCHVISRGARCQCGLPGTPAG